MVSKALSTICLNVQANLVEQNVEYKKDRPLDRISPIFTYPVFKVVILHSHQDHILF
jgi:hypothetical protein